MVKKDSQQKQKRGSNIDKLMLQDYKHLKRLGSGQFGYVYLVYNTKYKQYNALKCMYKGQIVQERIEKYISVFLL